MPMPMPSSDESEQDYVNRFMGNDEMVTEYPDEKQRAAVAYKSYRDEDQLCDDCEDESDGSGIPSVSILTIGEAKGHDLYVDDVSLEKALTLMKSAPNGVKVKLNHGSGLENVVGFARNPRITEDKLVADLHLLKSSPHYGLIKEMASEAPDQFGVSLAFYNETEEINGKEFIRPISVKSADLVGEPAANASLFEALTQFSMKTAKALGIEFAGDCGQNDDGTFGPNNTCGGNEDGSISESEAKTIKNARGAQQVVADRLDDVVNKMNSDDPNIEKALDYVNTQVDELGKFTDESSKPYYSRLGSLTTKIKNTAKSLRDSDSYVSRKNGDILDSYADTIGEIREVLRNNASSEFSRNNQGKPTNFVGSCGQEDDGTFGGGNDCAVGHGRPSKGDSDPRDRSRPLPPPTKENTSYKGGIVQQAGPSDPSKNQRLLPATRKQTVKARQAITQEASDVSKVNPKISDPAWTGTKSIQADNIKGIISDFKKQTSAHKYGPTTDRQKAYYKQTASQLKEISKKLYDSSKSSWNNDFNKLAYSANEVADQIDRLSKARSIFEEGYNNLNKLLEFRCWEGYEPVAGKAPYSKGSCKPIEAEKPFDKEKNTMNEDYNKVMEALSALERRLASLEEGNAPMDEEKSKKDEAMAEAPKIVIEKEDDKEEDVAEMSAVIKKVLTEFGIKPVPASPATEVKKVEAKNFEALVKSHAEYANSKLKAIRAVMLSHPNEYREATQRGITTL